MDLERIRNDMNALPAMLKVSKALEEEIYQKTAVENALPTEAIDALLHHYEAILKRDYYAYAHKIKTTIGKDRREMPLEIRQKSEDLLQMIGAAEMSLITSAEHLHKKSTELDEAISEIDSAENRKNLYDVCESYSKILQTSRPQPDADGLGCIVNRSFDNYCEFHRGFETRNALLSLFEKYISEIRRDTRQDTAKKEDDKKLLKELIRESAQLGKEFVDLEKEFKKSARGSHIHAAYSLYKYSGECERMSQELDIRKKENGITHRIKRFIFGEKKQDRPLEGYALQEEPRDKTFMDNLYRLPIPEESSRNIRDIFTAKADPSLTHMGTRFMAGAEYIDKMKNPSREDKIILKLLKYSVLRDAEDGYLRRKLDIEDLSQQQLDTTLAAIDRAIARKTAKTSRIC